MKNKICCICEKNKKTKFYYVQGWPFGWVCKECK